MVQNLSTSDFNQNLFQTDKLIVLDFWAPWCGPCKMMSKVLNDLSKQYNTSTDFFKINVDENQMLSSHFQVSSIPTLVFIKNGYIVDVATGFQPYNQLEELVKKHS